MQFFESLKIRATAVVLSLMAVSAPQAAELLVIEQENCPYCEKFHAQIGPAYPNTVEGKRAPLRFHRLDEPLPKVYNGIKPVVVTPTFILIEDNQEVDRLVGYPGDEYFWYLLGEMLEKLGTKSVPGQDQ